MNCKQCGKPLNQGDAFCVECGARVMPEPVQSNQVTTNNVNMQSGGINPGVNQNTVNAVQSNQVKKPANNVNVQSRGGNPGAKPETNKNTVSAVQSDYKKSEQITYGNAWISYIKFNCAIIFIFIVIASFLLAMSVKNTGRLGSAGQIFEIVALIGGLLLAFSVVSKTMMNAKMAEDISAIKSYMEEIINNQK